MTDKYEVWIQNGLKYEPWSKFGGPAGPMSKKKADEYVDDLFNRADIMAKAVKMR